LVGERFFQFIFFLLSFRSVYILNELVSERERFIQFIFFFPNKRFVSVRLAAAENWFKPLIKVIDGTKAII